MAGIRGNAHVDLEDAFHQLGRRAGVSDVGGGYLYAIDKDLDRQFQLSQRGADTGAATVATTWCCLSRATAIEDDEVARRFGIRSGVYAEILIQDGPLTSSALIRG